VVYYKEMKQARFVCWIMVRIVAIIELSIGSITILGLTFYPIFFISRKPTSVFIFVLVSSVISTILGYGIIRLREWARHLLVFFSGYVVFTKILLFMRLLEFKGEIITVPPSWLKNDISLIYHILLIVLLENKMVKKEFNCGDLQ